MSYTLGTKLGGTVLEPTWKTPPLKPTLRLCKCAKKGNQSLL